jgi:short-subunit dehydrogenase
VSVSIASNVLITGASSGIGAAIAAALAEPMWRLILVGRDEASLESVAKQARRSGAVAEVRTVDLTRDDELRALREFAPDRLDVLIHSAGTAELGSIDTLDLDAFDRQLRLNLRAPLLLTQALLPKLRQARGLVVFVNSGSGLRAKAGWGGYAASKFALRAIADALREEEQDSGVRVTSLYPGRTDTPMQRAVRRQEGGPYQADSYLRAEEVARMVAEVVRLPASATVPDLPVRPG